MDKNALIKDYCLKNNLDIYVRDILLNIASFKVAKTNETKLAYIDISIECIKELLLEYKEPILKRIYSFLVKRKNKHYTKLARQPIDLMLDLKFNTNTFYICNVIKYLSRYKDKDGIKDIQKAKHYLELIKNNFTKDEKNS